MTEWNIFTYQYVIQHRKIKIGKIKYVFRVKILLLIFQ